MIDFSLYTKHRAKEGLGDVKFKPHVSDFKILMTVLWFFIVPCTWNKHDML